MFAAGVGLARHDSAVRATNRVPDGEGLGGSMCGWGEGCQVGVGRRDGVKAGQGVVVAGDVPSRLGAALLVGETVIDDRELAVGVHGEEIVLFWGRGLEVTPVEIVEGVI